MLGELVHKIMIEAGKWSNKYLPQARWPNTDWRAENVFVKIQPCAWCCVMHVCFGYTCSCVSEIAFWPFRRDERSGFLIDKVGHGVLIG